MPNASTQTTLSFRPSDLLSLQRFDNSSTNDVGCQCDPEIIDDSNNVYSTGSTPATPISVDDTVSIVSETDSGYDSIAEVPHVIDIQLMIDEDLQDDERVSRLRMELEFLRDTIVYGNSLSLDQLYDYLMDGTIPPNWHE